ncbi:MAG: YggS family pyridoxal phosphate enzyme [bacterium]|nr:YggS family pyridoxal phosphate enzyme [bacterium]
MSGSQNVESELPGEPTARSRIDAIRDRLQALGRPDVRIIGVSKTHGPERIVEVYRAGLRDFGENRQNEARDKFPLVARALDGARADAALRQSGPAGDAPGNLERPTYHHIGPLQSGSARQIPGLFDYVHGVSSLGPDTPLDTLMKAAERRLSPGAEGSLHYLVQVALTAEETKAGGMPIEAVRNLDSFPENDFVRFAGFMTMGPQSQEPVLTRQVFQRLRELRDAIFPEGELSMGMSGDWELAVAEGATMIRVGTAIFGPRGAGPWKAQARPQET